MPKDDDFLFQSEKLVNALSSCARHLQEPGEAHEAMSFGGGYLVVPNVGLLGSHGATVLPLAATLLAWGREGIAKRIEHCMELSERLASRVAEGPEQALFEQPVTGVVVWRPRYGSAKAVRDRMQGAFVSLTRVGNDYWFRSMAATPMRTRTGWWTVRLPL